MPVARIVGDDGTGFVDVRGQFADVMENWRFEAVS